MTKQCYFCNKVIRLDSLYCTYCGNKDITKDDKSIARLEHMNTTKIQNKGSLFTKCLSF